MLQIKSTSMTLNSGYRRLAAIPVKTSYWLATSVTWQQKKWWTTQQQRNLQTSWASLGNQLQKCHLCRAGLHDHGCGDQEEDEPQGHGWRLPENTEHSSEACVWLLLLSPLLQWSLRPAAAEPSSPAHKHSSFDPVSFFSLFLLSSFFFCCLYRCV